MPYLFFSKYHRAGVLPSIHLRMRHSVINANVSLFPIHCFHQIHEIVILIHNITLSTYLQWQGMSIHCLPSFICKTVQAWNKQPQCYPPIATFYSASFQSKTFSFTIYTVHLDLYIHLNAHIINEFKKIYIL